MSEFAKQTRPTQQNNKPIPLRHAPRAPKRFAAGGSHHELFAGGCFKRILAIRFLPHNLPLDSNSSFGKCFKCQVLRAGRHTASPFLTGPGAGPARLALRGAADCPIKACVADDPIYDFYDLAMLRMPALVHVAVGG